MAASSASSTATSTSQCSSFDQSPVTVIILEAKSVYQYTIPSFCAITMKLQHVLFRCWENDEAFDGYVHLGTETHRMDKPLPARVEIITACLVPKGEFSLEINTDNLKVHPRGVFVMYEWEWKDGGRQEDLHNESHTSLSSHQTSPSPPPDTINVTKTPMVTHTVVFKCIGATRDEKQQRALEQAYIARQTGETVPVKIEPEPNNPYDSKAISFRCMVGGSWHTIGYVVREVLDEVHEAITGGHILWVRFAWVKFLLQWTRSGPGFYAGIHIARRGEWSNQCVRSASTKS